MGGSSSKTSVTSVVDVINEKMTDITTKMVNSSSQSCTTNQTLNVEVGETANIKNCDFNMTNTSATVCNMAAVFNQSGSTSILNQIDQAIDNAATSSNKQTQSFLSAPISSNSTTDMRTHIKNISRTKLTTEMQNTCIQNANVDQRNTIVIKGKFDCSEKGSITGGNNAQVNALSSCVASQLLDVLSSDETVNNAIQSSSTTSESKSTGPIDELGSIITGIFSSISQAYIALIAAGVIVLIVLAVFAYYFFNSSGGEAIGGAISSKISEK